MYLEFAFYIYRCGLCGEDQVVCPKAPKREGLWDPTSVGEGKKAFLIRMWKPLPNRRVLKPWGKAHKWKPTEDIICLDESGVPSPPPIAFFPLNLEPPKKQIRVLAVKVKVDYNSRSMVGLVRYIVIILNDPLGLIVKDGTLFCIVICQSP